MGFNSMFKGLIVMVWAFTGQLQPLVISINKSAWGSWTNRWQHWITIHSF